MADSSAGPVRLRRTVVSPAGTGRITLQADVTNTSTGFLNDVRLDWRLTDANGATLAAGSVRVTLAPGETTTVHDTAASRSTGARVLFTLHN